ncbi:MULTISPECIES: sugar O-acetyltransferase [Acidobacteriaceae]|uniref:sugar O-acetyltransferase n=1 Tax=Acidobacteriaceae TaxID=204434 RepID=UPI00131AE0B0|nr:MULTISPECIES: sugar O-acetyltransferase [Acidobacteriaceae]MDW5265104.1 sugar O-acetyltransferase [Edaphobacter sp.]
MQPEKTEKEKMLSGELYDAGDPTLIADRNHATALLYQYNTTPHHRVTHTPLLGQLLAACGHGSVIRPPFFCDYGYNIRLGSGVFLNFNCVLLDVSSIEIGDQTQIGPAVQIYAADHPRDPEARRTSLESGRPVRIGANVWIGGGAIILPGITIGDDAIIGAGSVVTRNVPPGATVVGNPARPPTPRA